MVVRLPSLKALRAFEAVGRHLSFSKAADELHVTKAAVAQQVRQLEEEIGAPLVRRAGRALRLTEAGLSGLRELGDGFDRLVQGVRIMREASGNRRLVINSSASFAATWLVARIGRFKQQHPEIDVLLDAGGTETDLWRANVDAAIRWGRGDFSGLSATLLFEEEVFPVCSPALLREGPFISVPEDLRYQTLLHLEGTPELTTWPNWEVWLAAAGVGNVETTRGVWFNQMSMALQSAVLGQGVALTTRALAADDLEAGRLIAPFETSLQTPFGYYFICRPDRADAPNIVALRDWLSAEAIRSRGPRSDRTGGRPLIDDRHAG
jgi:LysR family transcriptional regulator, glycine cleavage system transcriptional activator